MALARTGAAGWAPVVTLLGRISTVPPRQVAAITKLAPRDRPFVLGFVNAHAVNLACAQASTAAALAAADLILRDGKGVEMVLRRAGQKPGVNMAGTDLIPRILAANKGRRLAIFGSEGLWLASACGRLAAAGHQIHCARDGYRDDAEYLAAVGLYAPEIVVLAMGMPRQEMLAQKLARAFPDRPMLILCGGAILDFMGGRFPRAPLWMRHAGLEWLFRLWQEPRRLAQRYVIGVPLLLWRMARIAAALRAHRSARIASSGAVAGGFWPIAAAQLPER